MTPAWLALTRALLNVNFGFSALRHQIRRRHRVWEPILVGVSILVGVGGIAWLAASFATVIVEAGAQLGQPELALTFAHLIAAMVVFFFGVAFVMSSFYFSDDAALLMSWPLRPRQIVAAKFVTILVSEYLTIALILGPVYFVYARDVPVSGWFYLIAPVVFLLTPVAPLAMGLPPGAAAGDDLLGPHRHGADRADGPPAHPALDGAPRNEESASSGQKAPCRRPILADRGGFFGGESGCIGGRRG